jgi:hypothetical protein
MKKVFTAVSLVVGIVFGAWAGHYTFYGITGPWNKTEDVSVGPWTTLNSVGERNQSPYSRARVAIYGIWGLPPKEVIYFSAARDDDGNVLETRCTYEMRGGDSPARWWSIAVYRDGYYIDNPKDQYSLSQSTVKTAEDGSWTIRLSPSGEGENGLALGYKSGRVHLTYRLYQPNVGVAENRNKVAVPSIQRTGCSGPV